VVAENGDLRNILPGGKDVGAGLRESGARRTIAVPERMRNEIAGQSDQVGTKLLRDAHGALHAGLTHVRAKVNVADLGDAEAGEGFGQAGQTNLAALG